MLASNPLRNSRPELIGNHGQWKARRPEGLYEVRRLRGLLRGRARRHCGFTLWAGQTLPRGYALRRLSRDFRREAVQRLGRDDSFDAGAIANTVRFVESIRSGKYLNNARESVDSNLTSILARTAAYRGGTATWGEVLNAGEEKMIDRYRFSHRRFQHLPPEIEQRLDWAQRHDLHYIEFAAIDGVYMLHSLGY